MKLDRDIARGKGHLYKGNTINTRVTPSSFSTLLIIYSKDSDNYLTKTFIADLTTTPPWNMRL